MAKGKLIVIDGTDGSGKATQADLLFKRLKKAGMKVKKIDFPQYESNLFGKLLHEALKQNLHGDFIGISPKIASTLYAADRFESSRVIKKWLDLGFIVLCDRYVSASQIHQGGKIQDDKERQSFLLWLDAMEFDIFKIPRPALIIYLHVPLEISLRLIKERAAITKTKADQAESNAKHLFESQQSALKIIAKNNTWLKINCANKTGMRTREEIHEDIFAGVKKILKLRK